MVSWIKPQEGWLGGRVKPRSNKQIDTPQESESTVQTITRIRCPKCKSDKVKQYGKDRSGEVLYYRCQCGEPFKVIVKDTQ